MRSSLLPLGVALLFFTTAPRSFASAEGHLDEAVAVARNWVAEIDAGHYDESYDFGCDAMHDKVPQTRWDEVLKALRSPLGSVVSRHQISHIYKPNGFEGTNGEFMLITYDTSFKSLNPAVEVVVLKWEDGKWRGAGYNAGPKSSSDDVSAPQVLPSETEIHTEAHVKPTPQ